MTSTASPIDIATPTRHASSSPSQGNQTSNLTSALQAGGRDQAHDDSQMDLGAPSENAGTPTPSAMRQGSFSAGMSGWGTGTRPISMGNANGKDRNRRESLAGSLIGGMSWGGISVGSWIRDDILMAGTSPFTFQQTPSFHSSSYLPKLEANFMRDFSCCGITLPSLHDLLQHYEEAHAQQPTESMQRAGQNGQNGQNGTPNNRSAMVASAVATAQQSAQQQQASQASQGGPQTMFTQPQSGPLGASSLGGISAARQGQDPIFNKTPLQSVPDMDTVEDMEMDDDFIGDALKTGGMQQQSQMSMQSQTQTQQPLGFGQQSTGRGAPLNLNMANALQNHQGLRSSPPGTPATPSHGFQFQNNPTVSSVNTPTLSAQPFQQSTFSPDSSGPGTPAEGNIDFSNLGSLATFGNTNMFQGNGQGLGFGYGSGNEMLELCIDEPAKRLYTPHGAFANQSFSQGRNGASTNSELAKKIREQQMMAGIAGEGPLIFPGEEHKPFRCPVIGCEKAYKNQNGLKYHKAHGHTNQQLHENPDGTFSIVNPETSIPYPGTLGMEKEKPYRCEVCGKRYKNLNGLKYHKAHSPPCNPELRMAAMNAASGADAMQAMNVNIAGAGLSGMADDPMVS